MYKNNNDKISANEMDKTNSEQIQRIIQMEEIYDQSCTIVNNLLHAIQAYLDMEQKITELSQYYQSPLWLADFDDDRDGKIPTDLKRGILTEDAIYDFLIDKYHMMQTMQEIVERDLKQYKEEEQG